MNRIPILGLSNIFFKVSTLRLPSLSAITKWFSSKTRTDPGATPRGETSQFPVLSVVDRNNNGERAIKFKQCLSILLITFLITRSPGYPRISLI